jgi:hypothetical protein
LIVVRSSTPLLTRRLSCCAWVPTKSGGAVSLLLNLGAAQRGRSMLFLDEHKLLFKGWKKGFVMNTKFDFLRH